MNQVFDQRHGEGRVIELLSVITWDTVSIPILYSGKGQMTGVVNSPTLALEEFLKLPETKPASEFIDGRIEPKPMPQGKHSRLQLKFCDAVHAVAEDAQWLKGRH